MKISNVTDTIRQKTEKYAKDAKNTFDNTVKPFINEQIKYAKNLKKDTVEFVKKNPKKVGKYAALTLFAASAGAVVIKTIKDYIKTKKQNKILTKAVLAQRENNQELKNFIGVQKEIIAAKDAIAEVQKKMIAEQKAQMPEN